MIYWLVWHSLAAVIPAPEPPAPAAERQVFGATKGRAEPCSCHTPVGGVRGVRSTSVRVSRLLRPFLIFSLVSGTSAAFAAPVQLDGGGLKTTLNGALIEMDTPLGTKIPVRFGLDGLVSGEAGDLAPLLGSARDRGRWWIDGDRICSKWFRWFDAEPQCLSVQQDGTRLFWREDGGKTGTATLVEAAPAFEPKASQTQIASTAASLEPATKAKPTAETEAPRRQPASDRGIAHHEPVPLPIRSPSRAGTDEARVAAVAPAGTPNTEPVPSVRVETASVVPNLLQSEESQGAEISDSPMMRFGGAGLLEASARIASPALPAANSADAEAGSRDAARPSPPQAIATADIGAVRRSPATMAQPKPRPDASAAQRQAIPKGQGFAAPESTAAHADQPQGQRSPWTSDASIRAPGYYRVRGVQRHDVLNVRRGPSETHVAVAAIPPDGRRVKVTGTCQGDWCPVRYRRATGWVHSFYLIEEDARRGSASRVYLAQP